MASWLYTDVTYANYTRELFAECHKFDVPESVWRRSTIAFFLDDKLGVIFNTTNNSICGLVDSKDVELANYMPMSLKENKKCGYRLNVKDNRPEVKSGVGLSVAIMCQSTGYFTSDQFNVHHKANSCDNRRSMLELVTPNSVHPPKCFNSMVYIKTELEKEGYTVEGVVEYCKKCISERKTRLDF